MSVLKQINKNLESLEIGKNPMRSIEQELGDTRGHGTSTNDQLIEKDKRLIEIDKGQPCQIDSDRALMSQRKEQMKNDL